MRLRSYLNTTGEVEAVHAGFFVVIHRFALFSLHPLSSNIPSSHYDVQPSYFRLFSPCFLFPIIDSQEDAADRQTCIRTEELHWNFKPPHYLAVWTVRRRTSDHLHFDQYVYLLVPPVQLCTTGGRRRMLRKRRGGFSLLVKQWSLQTRRCCQRCLDTNFNFAILLSGFFIFIPRSDA